MTEILHFTKSLETNLTRREVLGTGAAAAAGALASGLPGIAAASPTRGKVTLVTGSPHRRGTSFLLADEFIRGMKDQGVDVYRFDAAFKRVTACSGCDRCGLGSAPCVYRDDMFELNPHFLESELIVLCSP
ncbi:flavodoxin family protein, partial [Sutterella sp.]|uniref:flavodoxin family protein n=1 Tax=Sutterella sp. TaxID=1981025 RepID=UPI002704E163|nr:hypothetical protein [Sutterella sp.]